MIVDVFIMVGLERKFRNKNVVVCTPGFIWGKIRKVAYKQRATRGVETFR